MPSAFYSESNKKYLEDHVVEKIFCVEDFVEISQLNEDVTFGDDAVGMSD